MSRSEWKGFVALLVACLVATVAVGIGLKLLGASSEVISIGFLFVIVLGGLGGGYCFDRYTSPPEKH